MRGVPRSTLMKKRATSARGLNELMRARATSTPRGSAPTKVMTKICSVIPKPLISSCNITESSMGSPSLR